MNIRKATENDIERISQIYLNCFPTERNHKLWIDSSFNSFPRGVYYVIEEENALCGYIFWCVKNGFRESTIIELEQIAIDSKYSGKGFGRSLIDRSFTFFNEHVVKLGHMVGAVMVTTSEGNYAEDLYKSTLGVSRAALLTGYGSGNEVILYNNSIQPTAAAPAD